MNREKQMSIIDGMDNRLKEVIVSKSGDYATEDVLSNFKRLSTAASGLGINVNTPTGYALFMVLMKIDRINNLVSSRKLPSNESVEDSFGDGINYLKLAYCCYLEENNIKNEQG
jgi:hypothetical protein